MTEVERLTELKSNDVGYMKKYLKLALEIETDVLVWEDALKTHRANLESTKSEIDEFNSAKRYCEDFERSKEERRTGILAGIEIFKSRIKEEDKKARRSFLIKLCVCAGTFLILTTLFYLLGIGKEMIGSESGTPEKLQPFFELIVSAAVPIMIVLPMAIFMFLISPVVVDNYSMRLRENVNKLEKELKALDQEEQEIIASNQYVNSALPQLLKKKSYLETMINYISYHLEDSKKVRHMIYCDGVLPKKYCNIVSVSSLYQFLENGICTQIKGHGGIYDTYEYHLKLREIIDNLEEIRRDLRRIQANQEFLYDKLCDVHETLRKINSGISDMSKEVVSNTAIAAESAKRSAIAEEWKNRELWYN